MWYKGASYDWSNFPGVLMLLIPFAIIDLVLRGMALWRSAKRGENVWFIFLLIINSLGILPLIYLVTHKDSKKG